MILLYKNYKGNMNIFYTYIYLDPRKPGDYNYDKYHFNFEPIYVGKGHGNRYLAHLKCNDKSHKSNKIKKIQSECEEEIIILKVYDNITEEEALFYEIELIGLIGRLDLKTGPLTNLTDGGDGTSGRIHSEETRRKIGAVHKGKIISEETKKRMSDTAKGKVISEETKIKMCESRKGSTHSEEIRKKISEVLKGKKRSEESKKNISEAHIGSTHSEETRKKISEYHKGKQKSEETKQRMREAQRLRRKKEKLNIPTIE